MKLRTLFIVIPFVLAYSMLNFIFLSTEEEYTSMSDYIESTKNEFSYDIQEVIYEENWTGYHIKMISGEWLDSKKLIKLNGGIMLILLFETNYLIYWNYVY